MLSSLYKEVMLWSPEGKVKSDSFGQVKVTAGVIYCTLPYDLCKIIR